MAACRAVHAVVAEDVAVGAAAIAAGNDGAAVSAVNEFDDAPQTRLLPHLLELSNVALSLRLNS